MLRLRLAICSASATLAATGLCAALPARADANATIAPPTVFSSSAGLPNGRVYEQVSPADKSGNTAGVVGGEPRSGYARADGNAVMFRGSGAMGASVSGVDTSFIAQRYTEGWATRSATPRPLPPFNTTSAVSDVIPSPELSQVLLAGSNASYVSSAFDPNGSLNLYLAGPDPLAEPQWISAPSIPDPSTPVGGDEYPGNTTIAGPPSDNGTVYFAYAGTLVPQDASRAPYASTNGETNTDVAEALYEWTRSGGLQLAGVLPDGEADPFGSIPANEVSPRTVSAGAEVSPDNFDNEISSDGSRALFVSPDPFFCSPGGHGCGSDTPELYVRETAADGRQNTELVSEDTLLPQADGQPAAAPTAPVRFGDPYDDGARGFSFAPFTYASPAGSHVFFQSTSQLTAAAPTDATVKIYDFDVEDKSLTYLPGVHGTILVSSDDGSRLIFVDNGEVQLWTEGPNGGQVTPIAGGAGTFEAARATPDGSVFVFSTNSLAANFNNAGGFEQIYRYEVATSSLACVSCPPRGVVPSESATLSFQEDRQEGQLVGSRGLSTDGKRVFFDSPDPLVAQDTDGVRDVYMWENSTVYLISSGASTVGSYYLDSSANGGDVFFATQDGLVSSDTDDVYDVYDARIAQPGDNPPLQPSLCQGSACQGAPSVPVPFDAPASATFSGLGNATQPVAIPKFVIKPKPKPKARPKAKAKAKHKKKTKRHDRRSGK
jgi:hypothetical protein